MNKDGQKNEDIFEQLSSTDHELVTHCYDPSTGLKAIIAVHNTTLGPGVGGTRMWPYQSSQEALTDALRLSRGMTLKNALAGLEFGGGKAVIIGDSRKDKTEALLRRYGKFIDNLNGKYITAEDVGMTMEDMALIRRETDSVSGLSTLLGGSGDPSSVTAYGTYLGMKAAQQYLTGSDSLNGKRITVQGIGSVGSELVALLINEGAKVNVFDIYQDKLKAVTDKHEVHVLKETELYSTPVDIFAPCALGGILQPDNIKQLDCAIVAGAANNQLLDEKRDSELLKEKGILYAPDFAVNAGGIINISVEYEAESYNRELALHKAERIYHTILNILKIADEKSISSHQAALWLAEERIKTVGNNLKFI